MFFYIAQKQCACKKTRFLLLKLIKLQAGDNMRRDLAWSHCIPMIVLYTVIALIIMSDLDLFALLRAKQHKTMFCSYWSGLHCKQLTAMWQSSTLCPSTVDSFVDSNEREYFLTLQAMHCRKTWLLLLLSMRHKCEFAIYNWNNIISFKIVSLNYNGKNLVWSCKLTIRGKTCDMVSLLFKVGTILFSCTAVLILLIILVWI